MEEIQTNIKKQVDEAAKVSKDGKIPKRFGKLTGFAKTFFGDVAIPLEYMFAAPYLAAGDIEGAKRATTAGLFGYGKVDFDTLKWHFSRCKALIFPGEEDFGIVPVEVLASGRPIIGLAKGGLLDIVGNESVLHNCIKPCL